MRSDTAVFSAAVIGRRFLSGLASDLLSAAAAAAGFLVEEDRREEERLAGGGDAPRICSTSVNALISAWRRSISVWRSQWPVRCHSVVERRNVTFMTSWS